MKNLCDPALAKFRDHEADRIYETADNERALGGAFLVPVPGKNGSFTRISYMRVIASTGKGQKDPAWRWDHVSVSRSDRCPTWEEMDFIKRLFFLPDEICFELHPAEAEHISNHPYCLHIWRPLDAKIPLPHPMMVGVKGFELQP
jgi:hypothetical protein